jgi:hypothetical protein
MSDEPTQEATEDAAPAKKGLPIKTVLVVAAMLVGEAGAIIGALMFLGQPSAVEGTELVEEEQDENEVLVEIPILKDKFANNDTGRLWYWDTELIITSKTKHAESVTEELERRAAEIRTGVGAVVAGARHVYFNEPGRATRTRQLLEYMRDIFGQDAEGEERISGVLIPKCIGFPADY